MGNRAFQNAPFGNDPFAVGHFPNRVTVASGQCTEVRNGRFSSGGGILSQLQWYQSDIQKLGFPKYEIKDN